MTTSLSPALPICASQWFNTPEALSQEHLRGRVVVIEAFLQEYKVEFPVAVDAACPSGLPVTICGYAMQGTPTRVLVDALGMRRKQWFGAT